jgi:hypothetical protein
MKRFNLFIFFYALAMGIVLATPLSTEQKKVQEFIISLYAIDPMTFEGETIGKKYDPDRIKREIYPKFFAMDKISHIQSIVSDVGFIRHPSLSGEDIGGFGSQIPSKTPKILPPAIKGNSASVDVYPDASGRTIYFLTKTSNGWRIINSASYNMWPLRNDGTCWEPFYLVKPTLDQLALETKECIKFRQSTSQSK